MSIGLDYDELKSELDSLREARVQGQQFVEAIKPKVQEIRESVKVLQGVNSCLQILNSENSPKLGSSVQQLEILSQIETESEELEMDFDKMWENWNEELPESLGILASVQNVDQKFKDIELKQREKIQEFEKLVRDEEIELKRLKEKRENMRKELVHLRTEFFHEVELLLKKKSAPTKHPDDDSNA